MADIPEQDNEDDIIHEHQIRDVRESKRSDQALGKAQKQGPASPEADATDEATKTEKPTGLRKSLADVADKYAKWTRK